MPGVVLTEKYLTGIQPIDARHRGIVGMINDLGATLTRADSQESTGNILRKLIEHTESHFKMEEEMLQEHDYPDFSSHAASHKNLIKRAMTFEEMLRHGVPNIGSEILHFLQAWFFNHILTMDMAYVPCVTGRTVTPSVSDEAVSPLPQQEEVVAVTSESSPDNDIQGADGFVLTDELLTGIDEIDTQHRKLFQLVNGLNAAIALKESHTIVGQTIGELVEYTRTHFATEEAIMARCHYPQIAQHKKEHKKLLHRVLIFKNMYEHGAPNIESEILCFLKDWLLNHIEKTDMDYAPFAQAHREVVVS